MENETNYFNIIKYIEGIEIEQSVLEHLAEIQDRFNNYLKMILSYGREEAMTYLTLELFNELLYSNQIEEDKVLPPSDFLNCDLIATGRNLTNKKICNIQKMLLRNVDMPYPIGEYRTVPVFIRKDGEIVYNAPDPSDVGLFMNDFIRFYNNNSDNLINNDPFIKAALLHMLFVKIHPFVDGNGRVARIIHNLKFTDLVNKTYADKNGKELELKLAPLNISYSIYNNRFSYYAKLKNIDFSEGADINSSVNKWIDFLLFMYEEQLYYAENSSKVKNLNMTLKRLKK